MQLTAMLIFRRPVSIIRNGHKLLKPRLFHSSPLLEAKYAPKRSPTVSAKLRQSPNATRVPKTHDPEACLPPLVLLQSGHKSGALPIDPHKALDVLRRYQALAIGSNAGWEQRLCTEFEITPSTLVLLARILNRCPHNGQRQLAREVMLSASELGEASATFDLIEAGIRSASLTLQAYAAPLQRLGLLAKKDGHRQAMVLLGKVLLSQQKELEALEWFRKASQGPSESLDFEGAAEALVNEGRILLEQKDEEGAGAAFRKAAVDLDDPTGYFYLSKLADPDSPQQQVYLLKAASAGIVEAWHNLGSLELARLQAQPAPPKTFQDFGMAREWFQVAAADGFGLSMLNLALMCKAVGQPGAGMEWLEKAETVPEVREQARSLKAQWRSEKVELS